MPTPSLTILRDLTWKLLQRTLRVGPGFLGRRAIAGGTVGKLFRAFAHLQADWRLGAYTLQDSTTLSTADPDAIRQWGADLGVPQMPGETPEQWGARLRNQITVETSTLGAVEQAVWDAFRLRVEVKEPWELQAEQSVNAARSGSYRSTNRYYTGGSLEVVSWQYQSRIYPIVRNVKAAGVKAHYVVRTEGVYKAPADFPGLTAHDRAKAFYQTEAFVALGRTSAWGDPDGVPEMAPTELAEAAMVQVAFRKYYVREVTAAELAAHEQAVVAALVAEGCPNATLRNRRPAGVTIRTPRPIQTNPPTPDLVRYFRVVDPLEAEIEQPTMVWFEAAFAGDTHETQAMDANGRSVPLTFRQALIGMGSPRKGWVNPARMQLETSEIALESVMPLRLLNFEPIYRYGVQTEVFSQVLDFS